MDQGHIHRRCSVLQFGEGLAIWLGEFLWEGCLEDAQRLAEFHRAALELPKHPEHLLCCAHLNLGLDLVGVGPTEALAETDSGAAGEPQR